MLDKLSSTLWQ